MANPLYDAVFGLHAGNTRALITDPLSGYTLSYNDFLLLGSATATVISDAGLAPGDRLVAQVGKSVNALAIYAGCVQAGVVYLPLNTAYTPSEVAYFLGDCGASLLVCDPASAASLEPITTKHHAALMTLSADGLRGSFAEAVTAASSSFKTVVREPDDLAALLYTSGTTGRSKGAMLTQQNLLSNAQTLCELWQFTQDDVLLHALPIFHTHGLFVATNVTLLSGASLVLEPSFHLDRAVTLLPHVSAVMGVPTFYTRFLSDERFNRALTESVRIFISGSAPLLAETHTQFEARTGHRILERYGMTETNMITSNPYTGERRAGTVGHPLPGVEVQITDPDSGQPIPDGDIGIIEVRGPNVFKGYWNMPDKTAAELRDTGFFITGDLGQRDNDGYISIVGRNKDLIISGGYNIYPKEIELLLDQQPGVEESAVIGVPHADFGESVVGVLVGQAHNIDTGAIQASLGESLARFKLPRTLVIVDALPRNTMGKVQKNVLRDHYSDSNSPLG